MAQAVKQLTVDFSSVHDLWVGRLSPMLGSMLSTKPTWESFCPSSSAPPHPSHMLSLSFSLKNNNNKLTEKVSSTKSLYSVSTLAQCKG